MEDLCGYFCDYGANSSLGCTLAQRINSRSIPGNSAVVQSARPFPIYLVLIVATWDQPAPLSWAEMCAKVYWIILVLTHVLCVNFYPNSAASAVDSLSQRLTEV